MDLEEVREWYASVTYMPGYYFEIEGDDFCYISLVTKLPDSRYVFDFATVRRTTRINLPTTEEILIHTSRNLAEGIALHEVKEWLKHGGKNLINPH